MRRVSIDFRFRGEVLLGMAPAPIAVVSDNGPCFSRRGVQDRVRRTRTAAATRSHPGAITPGPTASSKGGFGTLKYEH